MANTTAKKTYNSQLATAVNRFLTTRGYRVPMLTIWQWQVLWSLWYRADVDGFHAYRFFNGSRSVRCERNSMNLPKIISEEWASSTLNEKVEISTPDKSSTAKIKNVLDDNNFMINAPKLAEEMFAIGTSAFVESKTIDGKIKIDYVMGEQVFPISWDTDGIKECAFAWEEGVGDNVSYRIVMHLLGEDGKYLTEEVTLKQKKDAHGNRALAPSYSDGKDEGDIIVTNSIHPLFQVITPNIVNNFDRQSPLGVSIFANAISYIKKADIIFDGEFSEFTQGRKKTFVDDKLSKRDLKKEGSVFKKPFPMDTDVYYGVEFKVGADGRMQPPIHEFNPELRVDAYNKGLSGTLRHLSYVVGFGKNGIVVDPSFGVKTATEVNSENYQFEKNRNKHLLMFRNQLTKLARAVLFLLNEDPEQEITIDFDDGIIEDRGAIQTKALEEFNAGLIDTVEYFVKAKKMGQKQAERFVKDMKVLPISRATLDQVSALQDMDLIDEESALKQFLGVNEKEAQRIQDSIKERQKELTNEIFGDDEDDVDEDKLTVTGKTAQIDRNGKVQNMRIKAGKGAE